MSTSIMDMVDYCASFLNGYVGWVIMIICSDRQYLVFGHYYPWNCGIVFDLP